MHRSTSTVWRRCRAAIDQIVGRCAEPAIPGDDLVMLVDGLSHRVGDERWVQYTVALKPVADSMAYFLDPLFISGAESAPSWCTAFDTIVPEVAPRIRALVSDGLRGMKELAASKGWLYQRCHYHIRAQIKPWLWILPREDAGALVEVVSAALTTPDPESAEAARAGLRAFISTTRYGVSGILRQLLHDWAAVRCYLDHPDLHIPTTTNVVESMHNLMRDTVSQASTLKGIMRRATGLTRTHPPFACNGHAFQQN